MTDKLHRRVVCTGCGAINRLPVERDWHGARCGSCKITLFAGRPAEVDEAAFERHVAEDELPILVDVWAPWCGPCRSMAPMFERAAAELEPEVRLLKLNADTAPQTVGRLQVSGIPALLLFRGGRVVGRTAGVMDSGRIAAWTRAQLAA